LHSFLGLYNFFKQLVHIIVTLLTILIQYDDKYNWIDENQKAFKGLKYVVTYAHVLTLFILGEPFEIIYNASMVGIGAIILQKCKMIVFESQKLFHVKKNYTIGDQEHITVVQVLQTW
jgi:hypothetical protein